jgi:nucleoside 2-deoxyribosyltransferase
MSTDKTFAFVLMPFANAFEDVYRIGIKEPAEALGIRAERVDEQIYVEGILERIYRQIEAADIVIADMSGQNANVFYEVGYAHAKQKLCILLTNNADDIPFDLKHRRHIVYGSSIQMLRAQLSKELTWAISEIDTVRKSRIRVTTKSISATLKHEFARATADLHFLIDLHNDSEVPSAEVETIYFYTSANWKIQQSDVICAATDSDLPGYDRRHFLRCPVKRLQRSGWAQIDFRAERVMASKYRGEEMKDSYLIRGAAVLRLVTDRGLFDYSILIDATADLIPF